MIYILQSQQQERCHKSEAVHCIQIYTSTSILMHLDIHISTSTFMYMYMIYIPQSQQREQCHQSEAVRSS